MRYFPVFLVLSSQAFGADLTIYTYDSFTSEWGPGPIIEKDFEAECDCDIEFVTAGDGAMMLTRLRIEGDKTHGDVVLGLDQNLLPQTEEMGMFAPHELPPQELQGAGVRWDNPDFIAYDWGQFAFVYNEEAWEAAGLGDVPQSLEALAQSEARIVIEDPRSSTPGLGLAMWVEAIYGDQAEMFWQELKDNIVTVTPGWSEAYALFLEGEADMVLSYTTSPAYHRIAEEDERFHAAVFEEGHGVQIEMAGLIAGSPHQDLGKAFLEFLLGEKAQRALMTSNWMYPVSALELPEGFDAPESFQSIDPIVTAGKIDAAMKAYENGMK